MNGSELRVSELHELYLNALGNLLIAGREAGWRLEACHVAEPRPVEYGGKKSADVILVASFNRAGKQKRVRRSRGRRPGE